jgi:hypothetical protein
MTDNGINRFIEKFGTARVLDKLQELEVENASDVLTIIANAGSHHAPDSIKRGFVYEASRGNLDFGSADSVHEEYERILRGVVSVLKERAWKKIYLIPFGHTTLALQIKMVVYRVTGIDTVDWFYHAPIGYFPLVFPLRQIIVSASDQI